MDISFRNFKDSDYAAYERLNKIYRFDCNKQNNKKYLSLVKNTGFLVGDPVTKSFLKTVILSECALNKGKVVGISRVERMTSKMASKESILTWLGNENLKKKFHDEKGWLIGLILVDPEYKGKGIAKLLVKRIEDYAMKNKCEDLFSYVATKPNNFPSLKLHQNLGYQIVAIYNARESFGILNYQSKLFYKHIK